MLKIKNIHISLPPVDNKWACLAVVLSVVIIAIAL